MSIGASPQMSNFPFGFENGATLRGLPINPTAPGRVFWVYNGTNLPPGGAAGSDNNRGTFLRPFATMAGALAQCVANRGDIVFVKPGHSETFTTAAGFAGNVAGVQIIGLGIGATRPSIAFTTSASASLNFSAAQMALRNFQIDMTGVANLAAGLTVTAADFQLTDSYIKLANATNQAVLGLSSTAAANGLTVNGCKFEGTNNGTTTPIQFVGGDNLQITNSFMMGAFVGGTGAISNITTAGTNVLIAGNFMNNLTAASTKTVTAVAGTTGFISDNRNQILSGTAPYTAAGMSWVGGNYYAATIATAGTLI